MGALPRANKNSSIQGRGLCVIPLDTSGSRKTQRPSGREPHVPAPGNTGSPPAVALPRLHCHQVSARGPSVLLSQLPKFTQLLSGPQPGAPSSRVAEPPDALLSHRRTEARAYSHRPDSQAEPKHKGRQEGHTHGSGHRCSQPGPASTCAGPLLPLPGSSTPVSLHVPSVTTHNTRGSRAALIRGPRCTSHLPRVTPAGKRGRLVPTWVRGRRPARWAPARASPAGALRNAAFGSENQKGETR